MLAKKYDSDISLAFPAQIVSFRSTFRSILSTKSTILEIAHLLLVDYYELSCTFSDVSTAYMLLRTLPVTVATCERSFSKLKLIKNYLRSTMSEERLSDLAMLSIENERAKHWIVLKWWIFLRKRRRADERSRLFDLSFRLSETVSNRILETFCIVSLLIYCLLQKMLYN